MDDIDQPAWLKIMQNGSVGEARTKAFLLDRFWVLERSVDIDGADFLVQPRALGTRFTDRSPPKIGVVQAKYFQNERTVHHIPRKYVLDEHGLPLAGFFAILHVGAADNAKIYMLSAEDMVDALDETKDAPKSFIVSSKAMKEKFRVDQHRRQALDRIEDAIRTRSPAASIHFLDRVNIPFRRFTVDDLDHRYKRPIPNQHMGIAKYYHRYRERLKLLTYDMEEALTVIDAILQEPDPRKALEELKKLEDYRGGTGWGDGLTFSTRDLDLDWDGLVEALDEHDARTAALEAIGKLEVYLDLSHRIVEETRRRARRMDPADAEGQYLWLRLDYDPQTLGFERLRLTMKPKKPKGSKARLSEAGYLHKLGGTVDISGVALALAHACQTRILLDLCPDLREDD